MGFGNLIAVLINSINPMGCQTYYFGKELSFKYLKKGKINLLQLMRDLSVLSIILLCESIWTPKRLGKLFSKGTICILVTA